MIKKLALAATLFFAANLAQADCYGTGNSRVCFDNSGNSYSINRIGNTTYLNGSNASTGSTWSQTSSTWGDTTYHSGRAADGNAWNSTQIRGSYGTSTYGTDSRGRSFSSFEINSDPYSLYD